MPHQLTDQSNSIAMETNSVGELILSLCDGEHLVVDIIDAVIKHSYADEDMASWDPGSVEDLNKIEDVYDITFDVIAFVLKLWRLGVIGLRVKEEIDTLYVPLSDPARLILAEARGNDLTYQGMRTLIGDEQSFQLMSINRRGEERPPVDLSAFFLSEARTLVETGLLLPRTLP